MIYQAAKTQELPLQRNTKFENLKFYLCDFSLSELIDFIFICNLL